jgi:hypothetical protein
MKRAQMAKMAREADDRLIYAEELYFLRDIVQVWGVTKLKGELGLSAKTILRREVPSEIEYNQTKI